VNDFSFALAGVVVAVLDALITESFPFPKDNDLELERTAADSGVLRMETKENMR